MRTKKRNPFGIDAGDIVILAIVGAGLMVVINKVSGLGNVPGMNLFPKDAPKPTGITMPAEVTFQLISVNYEGWVFPGATLHVTWTFNHLGPGGNYIAGIQFRPSSWLFGIIGIGTGDVIATFQQWFSVPDDATYRTYTVSGEYQLDPSIAHMTLGENSYIMDANGNVLATHGTMGKLFVA